LQVLLRLAAACAAALVLAAPAAAHTDADGGIQFTSPANGLGLAWPANGDVTRGFGPDPVMGDVHPGIDIGSLLSLDVHAAVSGTIEQTGYAPGFDGYGEIVMIDAGDGYQTLYAHLSRVDVHPGERVEAGEQLGLAGSTGRSTGTHLHFEVRLNDKAIDPAPLLPAGPPRVSPGA
jgi:murein DD-endopeptidase MepM/ murein hydrolase activator NlpD